MSADVLPASFYDRDTDTVARRLIGKIVVRSHRGGTMSGRIVETEAYLTGDAASHSFNGPTTRNAAMFGPPGRAYVFFTYGVHFMFNCVTRRPGIGEAVLIRAIEPVDGIAAMRENRGARSGVPDWRLCSGPGNVARALDIHRDLNGADLTDRSGELMVVDAPCIDDGEIAVTTRIGIRRAADLRLRFYLRASKSVSRR
jgi:DNA-3-methyladenine glycosylase